MLSRLWLHEPSTADVERAVRELGLPRPDGESPASALAEAYANIFLLNVFPYGSAFTDADGELNSASARLAARAFEEREFVPRELGEVAAADHLGLCLAFLESIDSYTTASSPPLAEFLDDFVRWAPVCCLAVEREPGAHAFYRSLAGYTRGVVLEFSPYTQSHIDPQMETEPSEDETRLSDILRFLLAPTSCGIFLSRARLGHLALQLGQDIRLPFGTRYEVARSLFTAAGESDVVEHLFDLLAVEMREWQGEYQSWMTEYPSWDGLAWIDRTASSSQFLSQLRAIAASKP